MQKNSISVNFPARSVCLSWLGPGKYGLSDLEFVGRGLSSLGVWEAQLTWEKAWNVKMVVLKRKGIRAPKISRKNLG